MVCASHKHSDNGFISISFELFTLKCSTDDDFMEWRFLIAFSSLSVPLSFIVFVSFSNRFHLAVIFFFYSSPVRCSTIFCYSTNSHSFRIRSTSEWRRYDTKWTVYFRALVISSRCDKFFWNLFNVFCVRYRLFFSFLFFFSFSLKIYPLKQLSTSKISEINFSFKKKNYAAMNETEGKRCKELNTSAALDLRIEIIRVLDYWFTYHNLHISFFKQRKNK